MATPPRRVGWTSPVALIRKTSPDEPVATPKPPKPTSPTQDKDKGQGKGKAKGGKGKKGKGKQKDGGKHGKGK